MTSGHYMNFISLQYGTLVLGIKIVKLVKPHVCSVSNLGLLYAQYLMLCGFSCFELFKFPNSAPHFINVGVSQVPQFLYHIPPKVPERNVLFISHSAEVAKMQHQNFANFGISIQRDILIINN